MRDSSENLAIAVRDHDDAEHSAQDEQGQRLQAIKITQSCFSWRAKTDDCEQK
jgi:hypothetical protein